MSNIPSELRYVASHEWIRLEDDGTVTVGVTDHAQEVGVDERLTHHSRDTQ